MQSITITDEVINKCTDFAELVYPTIAAKLGERGQTEKEKIIKDSRNGKIAEECIYRILSERFPNLLGPDYKIYPPGGKNWDADLIDPSLNLHIGVKSQDAEMRKGTYGRTYPKSWTFQNEDLNQLKNKEHYIAFVALDVNERHGNVDSIVKVQWLFNNNLFEPMMSWKLRSNKKAVYYDYKDYNHLTNYEDQLWQL